MGDLVSFSLSGRTSRRHYWAALLLLTLLGVAVESLQDFLFGITISETGFNVATGLLSAAGLIIGWLTITLFVRRFHDIDRTGWWALSVFIPFFVPVGVIVLGCLRGKRRRKPLRPRAGAVGVGCCSDARRHRAAFK